MHVIFWVNTMQVGHVVRVDKDCYFPADLLLLSSTNDDGIAYVETMNLDGETNLKIKKAPDQTKGLTQHNMDTFKVAPLASPHAAPAHPIASCVAFTNTPAFLLGHAKPARSQDGMQTWPRRAAHGPCCMTEPMRPWQACA